MRGVTWGVEQKAAFKALKEAFTTAPILQHFDYEKAIVVETMPLTMSRPVCCPNPMEMASFA